MDLRFYIDPETGVPHIARHAVTEDEVEDVIDDPIEDRQGVDASRVAIGQSAAGRYLRVVYVLDRGGRSAFVITAYELGPVALRALRRRIRRRQ